MDPSLTLLFFLGCIIYFSFCQEQNNRKDATCFPWSKRNPIEGVCTCPNTTNGLLLCNEFGYTDALQNCACGTYNGATGITEIGYCIYGCSKVNLLDQNVQDGYNALPSNISQWNEDFCGSFRREGTLCGACKNGSYAPVYSYDMKCVECKNGRNNLWKYVLWAFGPLTLFYFILLLFPINVISSRFMGFVFYSQMIAAPVMIRVTLINKSNRIYIPHIARFIETFYGIWNLDFFRTYNSGICLQTDTLTTMSLDLLVAIYPLLLIVITFLLITIYDRNFTPLVVLLKPIVAVLAFFKSNWNIRTSVLDSFVTFILLSNVKLLSFCVDLLMPVNVYKFNTSQTPSHSVRLYYDATVEYFGTKHLPYAVLAVVVLCMFILLPILLLTLYPLVTVQRCLNLLPGRCQLFLRTFVDSFQGCYQNGTELGTRDYRYLSAMHFTIRLLVSVIYTQTSSEMFALCGTIVLVLVAIFVIIVDPFKKSFQYISYDWQLHILILACYGTVTSLDALLHFLVHDIYITIFNIGMGITLLFVPILYTSSVLIYFICNSHRFKIIYSHNQIIPHPQLITLP